MLETLINNLGVKGQKTSITTKTLNGEVTNKAMVVKGLKVTSGNGDSHDWLELPDIYAKKYLPVDKEYVATLSKLKQWKHLESIASKISPKEEISVGLLIGVKCAKALERIDIIPSKNDGPYAFKIKLGRYIVGPVNGTSRKEICCNRIGVRQAYTNEVGKHFFQAKPLVKETDVKDMLARLYNQEFTERGSPEDKSENAIFAEDVKFMKILKDGAKVVNKHYQIPLPFGNPNIEPPNNRYQAWQRLSYLQKRFNKNKEFEKYYVRFMEEIISKRYARKSSREAAPGKIWYLPHHGVYHPNKPRKIRVVFDLSADYKGRCINRELLSGPDLTNQIASVLLRFREEQVAVMGDIEVMFRQVKVSDDQAVFLDSCGGRIVIPTK